ncbi:MAG: aminotransferase class V-fold PLP-dependent enzyme [Balneolaceae bacterium]
MNRFKPYVPLLEKALQSLDAWRSSFGDVPGFQGPPEEDLANVLLELGKKLEGNYPFHHPSYAGQMLKPPHPAAWLAYALTMTINPNNHALDGGPPTSAMEKEVIGKLAAMAGYNSGYLGHLTSAGTIANLEALFVAREVHPGKAIAATSNAHYTHRRMSKVLNTSFLEIPVDERGRPDFNFIKKNIMEIGTIVVTMGTTGLGYVEPLSQILQLAEENSVRVHVDAAYGGFFKLISSDLPHQREWDEMGRADSIVIDPHKHGLQPYGCGSVLYKDAAVGKFFKHDSPYTYFTSDDLHLGEISLECSRAGAAAAALWATLEILPLDENGLGGILKKARSAAVKFAHLIEESSVYRLYNEPDLDIAGYFKIPKQEKISEINHLSEELFRKGVSDKKEGFHVSLFKIPAEEFCRKFPEFERDTDYAVILRSVLMKEEHEGFVEELVRRLEKKAKVKGEK